MALYWLSARSRCSWWWVVVLCGVAALLTIKTYTYYTTFSQEYHKLARAMAMQSPLFNFQELDQVEHLSLPPPYTQTADLNREFLNESSTARNIFFPKIQFDGAVDPRKKKENCTSFFYRPGKVWLDTDGNPIQAHGGGILHDRKSETYYWYGEYKNGPTYHAQSTGTARVDVIGVGCYSSKDLWAWRFEGVVLAAEETDAAHDLYKLKVLERPKVIYNRNTGVYVMWMHIDDETSSKATVGVAVSDTPTGPFTYLESLRPNGYDSRDMTVFKDDDDGAAYLVYASAGNKEIHVSRLCAEYLDVSETTARVLVGMHREAPAVFKHYGVYYMVTSGSSNGWAPSEALVHEAESMMGPWETVGNPCVGANKAFRAATFFSQGSFVLPMPRKGDLTAEELFGGRREFIFMADRWNPANLSDSRYVWLPLTVKARGVRHASFPLWSKVAVNWHERWRPPIEEGEIYYVAKPSQFEDDLLTLDRARLV